MGSEGHYAALVQSSGDAIVAKDLDGKVVSWNPAAERLFGWRAEEMIGQSIRRLLPPEREHEEDDILAHIRQGEQVGLMFTERVHREGHRLFVGVTISPVRDASGKIVGACKIARDATERMEIERRLRESEARFRMLADNISQLAWIADPDGKIIWFNRRWTDYTGLTEDDPPDHEGTRVVHPDHVERVFARYSEAIASGEDYEDIFPLRGKDGDYRWFLSRATPIRTETGKIRYWFGTNTDITEQREQAEQIHVLLREVNHRSKNMLAKVQALARTTMGGEDESVRRFEQRIASMSVNQDILVSRDWGDVPIEELVRQQLAFASRANQQVAIEGPGCAVTPRGAEILGMALHELATNSLKYGALSIPKGRVAIGWNMVDGRFHMNWDECGGPPVAPPERRGFGTQLIVEIPKRSLGARVELRFERSGITWELDSPDDILADRVRRSA